MTPDKSCSNDGAVPAKRNKKEYHRKPSNVCFIAALGTFKETENEGP